MESQRDEKRMVFLNFSITLHFADDSMIGNKNIKKNVVGVMFSPSFLRHSEGPPEAGGPLPYLRIMKQQKQHEGSDWKKRLLQVSRLDFS